MLLDRVSNTCVTVYRPVDWEAAIQRHKDSLRDLNAYSQVQQVRILLFLMEHPNLLYLRNSRRKLYSVPISCRWDFDSTLLLHSDMVISVVC